MGKPEGKTTAISGNPDQILEDYLDTFARFGKSSAILVNMGSTGQVITTLDGTPLHFPGSLAEQTGLKVSKINALLKSGTVKGVRMGDTWLASLEALKEYQDGK